MKLPACSLVLWVFLLCGNSAMSQAKRPLSGKEPAWATINQYDYKDTRLDRDAEDGYFDVEYETQVSLADQSVYYRRAMKILTEAGIQNCSEISVSFDPLYVQLTFHSIRIIRGNETINQLKLSKMKTIQQEKELDRFLYNGALTSVLFLEDVHKGDIIEYSYTLKGFNPIFKGKYAGTFALNFGVPIGSLYYKLVVPKNRSVLIKNNNSDIKPLIQPSTDATVYEWKVNQVKAMRSQDGLPSWYDPYSFVMISEYKSWKEVNDWAMELFPSIKDLSAALQKKIDAIRQGNATKEKQVQEALRFVQDDIRYMGIEMGENSHKPANPNQTFSRRFGDCKDKSYLLCTMLNHLGVEASPVLINTSEKKMLTNRLPTAVAFDHVTVHASLDNKDYWFDPTISFQRGRLDSISYPDYQCGLIISANTSDLTMIDAKEKGSTTVKEVFDVPDMTGRATLTVTTKYTGSFADDARSGFNNNSQYEMQKGYRDFYASYYEKIAADSIQYTDDEQAGAFITKEFYSIDGLWEMKNGVKEASFNPYVIDGIIKKSKDIKRTMPLALDWPAKFNESIEIHLPEDWNIDDDEVAIRNSSFVMSAHFSGDGGRTVYLDYAYENLMDHVAPEDMKDYMDGINKEGNEAGYVLTYGKNKPSITLSKSTEKKDGNYFYIALFLVLAIGGVVWWTQRK